MTEKHWLITSAGIQMPPIIYGTAWKKDQTAAWVEKAIQCGFRGIDTACQPKHYNEPMVGEALLRIQSQGISRGSLFVQTKFTPLSGQDPMQVPYDAHAPIAKQVTQSFEVSRKNLRSDYIDSLVMHSPVAPHERLMDAWRAMEAIHATGDVRQLGLSNCYDINVFKALYADAHVKPAVLQNRFYAQTGYDSDLRRWCADHDIIYQSFWTLTANAHLLSSRVVQTLAREHGKTEAQILFRFLNQSGVVPLTGTCSAKHMQEDLAIFSFQLSPDECEEVNTRLQQFA